jgi:hypothetical protein
MNLEGTTSDSTILGDNLHQLKYEFVDPPGLKLITYSIESENGDPNFIGIEVEKQSRRFYAKRVFGRARKQPHISCCYGLTDKQLQQTSGRLSISYRKGRHHHRHYRYHHCYHYRYLQRWNSYFQGRMGLLVMWEMWVEAG